MPLLSASTCLGLTFQRKPASGSRDRTRNLALWKSGRQLTEAAFERLGFASVGMRPSTCRSLAGISLQIVSTLDPQDFVHKQLIGLGHGFELMLDQATGQLRGWC